MHGSAHTHAHTHTRVRRGYTRSPPPGGRTLTVISARGGATAYLAAHTRSAEDARCGTRRRGDGSRHDALHTHTHTRARGGLNANCGRARAGVGHDGRASGGTRPQSAGVHATPVYARNRGRAYNEELRPGVQPVRSGASVCVRARVRVLVTNTPPRLRNTVASAQRTSLE